MNGFFIIFFYTTTSFFSSNFCTFKYILFLVFIIFWVFFNQIVVDIFCTQDARVWLRCGVHKDNFDFIWIAPPYSGNTNCWLSPYNGVSYGVLSCGTVMFQRPNKLITKMIGTYCYNTLKTLYWHCHSTDKQMSVVDRQGNGQTHSLRAFASFRAQLSITTKFKTHINSLYLKKI